MWLVSVSHSIQGVIVPTEVWTRDERVKIADALVNIALTGRGDATRERSFRMNITLCRHRALSQEEHAGLSCDWHASPPQDIAGGPVEILWSSPAMPDTPSMHPCESPERRLIPQLKDPRLWLPIDCGKCPPCEGRAEIEQGVRG